MESYTQNTSRRTLGHVTVYRAVITDCSGTPMVRIESEINTGLPGLLLIVPAGADPDDVVRCLEALAAEARP